MGYEKYQKLNSERRKLMLDIWDNTIITEKAREKANQEAKKIIPFWETAPVVKKSEGIKCLTLFRKLIFFLLEQFIRDNDTNYLMWKFQWKFLEILN